MLDAIKKINNDNCITFIPPTDTKYFDSINYTLGNAIIIDSNENQKDIVELLNNSKFKKIYLFGYNDFYRYILPRLNKSIDVCWVYNDSFSNLSNAGVRSTLNTIFEYYDRKLINTIGCLSIDNQKVLENAGYNCEYINLKIEKDISKNVKSKSIGILSDDYDPNNNFYNQLATLTFIDYDVCKFMSVMKETNNFCNFFNIKSKIIDNIDDVLKNNFVNLYINFTNTNNELILKSYNNGVPVIVGNTNFYDDNDYLKEHLVVKSDDDINEIVEKINFVKDNYDRIMKEYNKI